MLICPRLKATCARSETPAEIEITSHKSAIIPFFLFISSTVIPIPCSWLGAKRNVSPLFGNLFRVTGYRGFCFFTRSEGQSGAGDMAMRVLFLTRCRSLFLKRRITPIVFHIRTASVVDVGIDIFGGFPAQCANAYGTSGTGNDGRAL
jgi:hypothetical protein